MGNGKWERGETYGRVGRSFVGGVGVGWCVDEGASFVLGERSAKWRGGGKAEGKERERTRTWPLKMKRMNPRTLLRWPIGTYGPGCFSGRSVSA